MGGVEARCPSFWGVRKAGCVNLNGPKPRYYSDLYSSVDFPLLLASNLISSSQSSVLQPFPFSFSTTAAFFTILWSLVRNFLRLLRSSSQGHDLWTVFIMAALQLAFALVVFTGHAVGVNNGLARTPQMGWVSYLS
jgi:hypothetical protein